MGARVNGGHAPGKKKARLSAQASHVRGRSLRDDLLGRATSLAALQAVLAAHKPGDRVQARLSHDGTASTVTLTLGSLTS